MYFFCFLALFFWFGGYFMAVRFMPIPNLTSEELEQTIHPPKWLYYLCGAPTSKCYPKGTMIFVAFRAQIAGVFMTIFLVWSFITKATTSENIVGFGLSMLFTFLLTSYISKHFAVETHSGFNKDKNGNTIRRVL
jgi:hypothetical protein